MAGPTIVVEAPTRVARTGGISLAADFRENDRIANADGVVFQSDGCDFPETEELRCYAAEAPDDKTASGVNTLGAIGDVFTLFAATQCFIGPDDDFEERSRNTLEGGRDREIEAQLAAWAGGGTALAAGTTAKIAVSRVDQALDAGYLGQGIILMSRFDVADAGLEYSEGELLRTKNGTPVVASGRIAPGVVYGIGSVSVEHSELVEKRAQKLDTNTTWALAEQAIAILVDCAFRVRSAITPA